MPFDAIPLKDTQAELPLTSSTRKTRHRLRKIAGRLIGGRTSCCGVRRTGPLVMIHRSKTGAYFTGFETCGSIWTCPVCAAKISEKRREDVATVINDTWQSGGGAYMVTLTMRHAPFDKCGMLRETVAKAWRKVQATRAWRALKADLSLLGTIRALEITHGGNGWHPHLHILLVSTRDLSADEQERARLAVFDLWDRNILKLTGRTCSPDACDLRPAKASDYLTKWGTDRELTKLHQKTGKRGQGGRTPWQILADYDEWGEKRDAALFREYAAALKGARHLTWSRGLKAIFRIDEIEDDDIAGSGEETSPELPLDDGLREGPIGVLDRGTADAIVRLSLTAEVLDAAHLKGWRGVCDLLKAHKLGSFYEDSGGWEYRKPPPRPRPVEYLHFTKENFDEASRAAGLYQTATKTADDAE